nr:MAG TPA: hypothetical protein [Caudoviricetes sp.]
MRYKTESWRSGLTHLTANETYGNVSEVRILHSPLIMHPSFNG